LKPLSPSSVERQDEILRFIEQMRRASVGAICEHFAISEATARRDLGVLAEQAKIQRVHGGALAISHAPPELPVYQRMNELAEDKARIGKAAASLLRDGETVFLGSGTTVLEVAHALSETIDLTVITNSLLVLNHLIDKPNISVVSLGGQLRRSELSMIGVVTEQALATLRADKVIIGIHAISANEGLTNRYLPETVTDRQVLRAGKTVIVVADHTKCERVSTVLVAPLSVVDVLVTDIHAPAPFVATLEQQGIQVLRA
jgi:DeoR/GlpR family transcriptional regulator of sugar metabolism